jgi:glycosyltransferase involved in cell wall biosynthesis
LRLVQLNLAFDAACRDPEQLLERYHTLTGWSEAVTAAGAHVHVVQRFGLNAVIKRESVEYDFVEDGGPQVLPPWRVSSPAVERVARRRPEVVHINGLMFPGMIDATRAAVGEASVLVAQDHSGQLPDQRVWRRLPSWLRLRRCGTDLIFDPSRWGVALRQLDACTFTAPELASRWHACGLPEVVPVIELPEASTLLAPVDRDAARSITGISGAPAVLYVGRLDANKDPLTVLGGFERALAALPHARLWMVTPPAADNREIRARIARVPRLRDGAVMVGPVRYRDMANYYSAADIFVSGSHHEGSGYALIEAMACGLPPCVTDIPAFRALVADSGMLWQTGDEAALSAALQDLAAHDLHQRRRQVRERFVHTLSWPAIAKRTLDAYGDLLGRRRAGGRR